MIYNVTTMHGSKIMIGQRGENLATTIEIDVSEWLAKWPGSTFNVLVRRPGDIVPYVTSTSLSGNILRWPVTSTDTANAGLGKIEVRATLNGVIKKSAIATIGIAPCILCLENEQPPELDPAVADVALEAAVRAENAALRAEESRVYNLLDNSYFPSAYVINQRGASSYSGSWARCIDRWICVTPADSKFWSNPTNVGIPAGGRIVQCTNIKAADAIGKTYTLAFANTTGTVYVGSGTVKEQTESTVYHIAQNYNGVIVWLYTVSSSEYLYAVLYNNSSYTVPLVWAALYEGAYTVDSLPAYAYKGYAAELVECMRYYENSWYGRSKTSPREYVGMNISYAQGDCVIPYKVPKRAIATVTFHPEEGAYTKWQVYNGEYRDVDVEAQARDGINAFMVRYTKTDADTSTWAAKEAVPLRGHWEASADL